MQITEKSRSVPVQVSHQVFHKLQLMAERRDVSLENVMLDVCAMVGAEIEEAIGRAASLAWYRDAGDCIENGRYVYPDARREG